ncbi:hypothetical protein AB0J71_32670 [Nonomuraea sp. NPDC049637]|uniref:hypothetical protein n=1 Tax=Nonomuraea sp. NPDC049637 TaxID=3154356 RepID=UPI0034229FE5
MVVLGFDATDRVRAWLQGRHETARSPSIWTACARPPPTASPGAARSLRFGADQIGGQRLPGAVDHAAIIARRLTVEEIGTWRLLPRGIVGSERD